MARLHPISHTSCPILQAQGFTKYLANRRANDSAVVRSVLGAALYPQFGKLHERKATNKVLTSSTEKVCRKQRCRVEDFVPPFVAGGSKGRWDQLYTRRSAVAAVSLCAGGRACLVGELERSAHREAQGFGL